MKSLMFNAQVAMLNECSNEQLINAYNHYRIVHSLTLEHYPLSIGGLA